MLNSLFVKLRKSQILKDSFWLLLGSFFLKGSNFVITILIARWISVPDMGLFSFVKASATTFTSIIIFFLGLAATKIIAEFIADNRKQQIGSLLGNLRIWEYSIFSLLILSYFIFENKINEHVFNNQINTFSIIFLVLIFIFSTDSGINQAMLIGFNRIKKLGTINIISATITFPISIILVLVYKNYYGAIIGLLIAYLIETIQKRITIHTELKKNNQKIKYSFEKDIFDKIFNVSLATMLMAVVTNLTFYYVKVLMLKEENGIKELAYFETAYQWFMIIGIISSTITAPVVAKVNFYKTNTDVFGFIKKLSGLLLLITIPYNVIVFIGKDFIAQLYGKEYLVIAPIIQTFAIASIFSTLFYLMDKILIGKNYVWYCLIAYLIFCSSFIACTLIKEASAIQISSAFLYSWIFGFLAITAITIKLVHSKHRNY